MVSLSSTKRSSRLHNPKRDLQKWVPLLFWVGHSLPLHPHLANGMKELLKKIANTLPFGVTQNQRYDRQTKQVLKKVCKPDSNCIDVGCHKGEIMEWMLKYAPDGKHMGFEPIPVFYNYLVDHFPASVKFHRLALSDKKGVIKFNYVISNPAYSGIKKRKYDRDNELDTLIKVETDKLDSVLDTGHQVDFMKIDVEGAEYEVLKGAKETLKRWRPVMVFEHGKGAADVYGVAPGEVFDFLTKLDYRVSTMGGWLKKQAPMSKEEFERFFETGKHYYFIAHTK